MGRVITSSSSKAGIVFTFSVCVLFLFLCLVLEAHCGRTYDKDFLYNRAKRFTAIYTCDVQSKVWWLLVVRLKPVVHGCKKDLEISEVQCHI